MSVESSKSRRKLLKNFGCAAIATGLAGCSGSSTSTDSIDYIHVNVYNPVYIGRKKGYFESHGVTVNNVGDSFGGPQSIQATSSGKADAGAAAITALSNAVRNDMEVRGVCDLQSSFEDVPIHRWLVRKDSNILGPSDLEGKRIGVNTLGASFHYTTLAYLNQHELTTEDVEFVTVPHPNMEQALLQGDIDIAGMAPPFTFKALSKDNMNELFNTLDVFGEIQVVQIFIGQHILNDSPELAESFLAGYIDSVDFIRENPKQSRSIMAEALGVDHSLVNNQKFQSCAKADVESTERWLSLMRDRNELDGGDIEASDIITNEFNPCL